MCWPSASHHSWPLWLTGCLRKGSSCPPRRMSHIPKPRGEEQNEVLLEIFKSNVKLRQNLAKARGETFVAPIGLIDEPGGGEAAGGEAAGGEADEAGGGAEAQPAETAG